MSKTARNSKELLVIEFSGLADILPTSFQTGAGLGKWRSLMTAGELSNPQ